MLSDRVVQLCTATTTVSSAWARDPSRPPGEIAQQLYGSGTRRGRATQQQQQQRAAEASSTEAQAQAQAAARRCGSWGPSAPSPLFLQAFADALRCLEADPLAGLVSPPLMGSHGTVPLTAVAPLADVVRHCANLVARAETEVFLVTCAWSPSAAQRLISAALGELSARAGADGRRVAVNLMYDAPGVASLAGARHAVGPAAYAGRGVRLPRPEDIPHVRLRVATLHALPLGTLHAKFCVVDRAAAVVMSNNMQDNDNLEMMVHVEGPVVAGLVDTALNLWGRALEPPPAPSSSPHEDEDEDEDGLSKSRDGWGAEDGAPPGDAPAGLVAAAAEARPPLPEHTPDDPHYDDDVGAETLRVQSSYAEKPGESRLQAANRKLNAAVEKPIPPTGPEIGAGREMTPYVCTATARPVPMALVSRPPYGCFGSRDGFVPQNEAWLSLVRNARRDVFIQTPDLNAPPLLRELVAALARGVEVTCYLCFGYNDLGEMIPGQGGTNDQVARRLLARLPDPEHRARLRIHNYVGKDQDHPIHHSFKSRSCHIKLLIADGAVGVQGSGNQDTQSWFHSLEVNVMVDSAEVCAKWREAIERNQNTGEFGRVAADGIWRDREGKPGKGYMGDPGRVEGLVKGVFGMAMKMEGLGGF
ncbi:uncharacterized protein UV8b_05499 [Ustilaginoidea virens]|uniref:PLD phosphodiesterase domain-containing protein n=1 Tax=Ustilaginoidea virens TaxID=1159556 RepID=A0A1B5L2I3_USTVR|nr:uncharacterized protein UV8b_05499 [Ustilaginoidea virens]QUC21256.1 hypothetical protein UV8b_05499 [Ustilaginoidea virens]GAO17234.1 hypothetical protein UVI_02057300 [Ustilaginoidea virens]